MPIGPKRREARGRCGSVTPSKSCVIAAGEIEDTIPDDGKDPAAKALSVIRVFGTRSGLN
jgi:hypothetical protein